jgi:serine/threonine protein phosphatase 1
MANKWAIGDIHGCLKTFRHLIEEKLRPSGTDTLYLLGDYVSKGPDSKGVIDYILQLQRQNLRVITLMGNHEEMLLNGLTDQLEAQRLLEHGGKQILESFGVDTFSTIPPLYIDWLGQLPSVLISDRYVLTHAGLNFTLSDPFSDEKAMRWIRDFEVDPEKIGHRLLVHAHSPVPLEFTRKQLEADPLVVVNLDGGCVYTKCENLGQLLALNLENRELIVQKNIEAIV